MKDFVETLKRLGMPLLKGLTIFAIVMIIDWIVYELTETSLVNIFQSLIYSFNLLIDKVQSWYIK